MIENKLRVSSPFLTTLFVITAFMVVGLHSAFGDSFSGPYRLASWDRRSDKKQTVTFRAEPATKGERAFFRQLSIPITLGPKERIVDGIFLKRTVLLVVKNLEDIAVHEALFNKNFNTVRRIEKRAPTTSDMKLFALVNAPNGSSNTSTPATGQPNPAPATCPITIGYAPFRCVPCDRLKQAYPETTESCPQIIHALDTRPASFSGTWPRVSWPGGSGNGAGAMNAAINHCRQICSQGPVETDPPPVSPPGNSGGPSDDQCTIDRNGKVTCGDSDQLPPNDGTPKNPTNPAAPPSESGPPSTGLCSVTYTCNYQNSRGTGTITCGPKSISVQGNWGKLDCKTCAYTPAPNCYATGQKPPRP
ncbi:MAG: hypothetical protein ACK5GN_15075 [Pseudomonadota bacterium]